MLQARHPDKHKNMDVCLCCYLLGGCVDLFSFESFCVKLDQVLFLHTCCALAAVHKLVQVKLLSGHALEDLME